MTRWQPYADLWGKMSQLRDEMDRLFESFGLGDGGWPTLAVAYPAVNVWDDSDHVYAEAELPGMELNDLEIYVTGGNQLTIKGERKPWTPGQGVWHRQERGFGSFSRLIELPYDVDAERVEARFHNGVLTITMPKSEAAKPRKITVKTE
ncbi:MAG TPA: Hsp20/alpha crystallin family protein [Gemmataceae bacterium]|nr:Hsp20/alpha crystallin family protein [Gemmataceae bacterium]